MEARAKLAGHAIHPMLIVFPLGLLVTGVVFDLIEAFGGDRAFATSGFHAIAAGIIGGVIAAMFGTIDWLAVPRGTRARRIGLLHGLGNDLLLVMFAVAWVVRIDEPDHAATATSWVLALVGLALSGVTGWLGGELVERLGVSIDPGADLDAPSSLTKLATAEPLPYPDETPVRGATKSRR